MYGDRAENYGKLFFGNILAECKIGSSEHVAFGFPFEPEMWILNAHQIPSSTGQRSSWEGNNPSAVQEIPYIYGT